MGGRPADGKQRSLTLLKLECRPDSALKIFVVITCSRINKDKLLRSFRNWRIVLQRTVIHKQFYNNTRSGFTQPMVTLLSDIDRRGPAESPHTYTN